MYYSHRFRPFSFLKIMFGHVCTWSTADACEPETQRRMQKDQNLLRSYMLVYVFICLQSECDTKKSVKLFAHACARFHMSLQSECNTKKNAKRLAHVCTKRIRHKKEHKTVCTCICNVNATQRRMQERFHMPVQERMIASQLQMFKSWESFSLQRHVWICLGNENLFNGWCKVLKVNVWKRLKDDQYLNGLTLFLS